MKVLVTDRLGEQGLAELQDRPGLEVDVALGLEPAELAERAADAQAWIVRSGTTLTAELLEAAPRLRVIGRAGIGVDNIDVEAATERGVVVLNTPDANATTTAELALAHVFSLARHLPQADRSLREGKWERSKLTGTEITGKTLGVIGFGTIGRILASRGLGLKMRVLAHDPFVAPELVQQLGAVPAELEQLLAECDFVSVHVPKNEHTKGLLNAERIGLMKPGAYLIQCARGGIVDEGALLAALESGRLAGAALDVFETEPPGDHPLLRRDDVVATPPFASPTRGPQAAVSTAICAQVADFLERGEIRNAVNLPSLDAEIAGRLAPWLRLSRRLGRILAELAPHPSSQLRLRLAGRAAELDTRPLAAEALAGLLEGHLAGPVNRVNSPVLAKKQGLAVSETRADTVEGYVSLLTLTAVGEDSELEVAGTLLAERHPRLVRLGEFEIEIDPEQTLLVTRHADQPGAIGQIGTALGAGGVNIAAMAVGTGGGGGRASAVLAVSPEPSEEVLETVRALPTVLELRLVKA